MVPWRNRVQLKHSASHDMHIPGPVRSDSRPLRAFLRTLRNALTSEAKKRTGTTAAYAPQDVLCCFQVKVRRQVWMQRFCVFHLGFCACTNLSATSNPVFLHSFSVNTLDHNRRNSELRIFPWEGFCFCFGKSGAAAGLAGATTVGFSGQIFFPHPVLISIRSRSLP